jgi:hypothetical protein
MIRAAHPHEIRLLPQVENVADRRYARDETPMRLARS